MGLIEAILIVLQIKRLEKRLALFSMPVGLKLFSVFCAGISWALISEVSTTEKEITLQLVGTSFVLFVISSFYFDLAWLCG